MFDIQILHSIDEIDAADWDRLSQSHPFSSHRWYRFGEAALAGDLPFYVLLSQHGELVASAVFWLARQEPLPISWAPARRGMAAVFRRWPLLVCRTALANVPGLILPDGDLRQAALETLTRTAHDIAREHRASVMMFDYLSPDGIEPTHWPHDCTLLELAEPGTRLLLDGADFDAYLSRLSKSARKDYHRHTNRAADLGIVVSYHRSAVRIAEAVELIRSVERHHHTAPYPHVEQILAHMDMVDSTWITAEIADRLVGCGLLLGDGSTQFLTLLGLDYTVNFAYFQLFYAAVRCAIETGVSDLRAGSGAYDFKQRFGFEIEPNNWIALKVNNWALIWLARRFAGG